MGLVRTQLVPLSHACSRIQHPESTQVHGPIVESLAALAETIVDFTEYEFGSVMVRTSDKRRRLRCMEKRYLAPLFPTLD
jgi:predicted MarR family transcription regulator